MNETPTISEASVADAEPFDKAEAPAIAPEVNGQPASPDPLPILNHRRPSIWDCY